MASHVWRDDRSLAAPVKAPHFFKIVLPDALRNWKIMIPKKFIRKCGERLSNLIFMKLPNGAEWKVQSLKCSGEVWLQEGWKEFAEYCSLQPGHFLVFKYEGNSHFHVLVFDGSAVEIDYPSNSSLGEKDKIDEEFRVTRTEKKDFSTFFKRREKSPISCPRPHKMMRILPSAKTASTSNLSRLDPHSIPDGTQSKEQGNLLLIKKDFEGVGGMSTTKRSPKSVMRRRIQTLTVNEKARALQKASGFKPENPSFVVVMQPSYVPFERSFALEIPSNFAKRYLKKDQCTIILRISDERNWTVEYVFKKYAGGPRGQFRYGWNVFAQDNNLEVGDVCVFELIPGDKVSFQVVIFRSSEEHCSASQGKLNFSAKEEGRDNSLRCPQSQGFKRQPVTLSLKYRAVERASAFHSKNPFFMVVMAPSYVNGKGVLYIPAKFAEKYFSTEDGHNLTLRMSGERIWSVKYTFRQFGRRRRARLSTGWRAFARDNKLEEGDVCIFEFIQGIEISMEVLIFRVTEGENSTASPGVGGMSTTKRSPKSVILERICTLTVDEKARALQKASGFKPENRSFMVVMQPSYVYFGWHLHIPSGFAKRYLNKKLGSVILRVSDGRNWSITYSSKMVGGELKVKFRRGWKEFAQCNHLELGDVCAFEMIKGMKKISFQVVIFRATEQRCPL